MKEDYNALLSPVDLFQLVQNWLRAQDPQIALCTLRRWVYWRRMWILRKLEAVSWSWVAAAPPGVVVWAVGKLISAPPLSTYGPTLLHTLSMFPWLKFGPCILPKHKDSFSRAPVGGWCSRRADLAVPEEKFGFFPLEGFSPSQGFAKTPISTQCFHVIFFPLSSEVCCVLAFYSPLFSFAQNTLLNGIKP